MFIIKPKPSFLLKAWLIGIHLMTSMALFFLPLWVALLMLGIICFSFIQNWLALIEHPKITTLILYHDDTWLLQTQDQQEISVDLLVSSIKTAYFVLLHFRDEQGNFLSKLIVKDSLSQETWRRLQVQLKIMVFSDDDA